MDEPTVPYKYLIAATHTLVELQYGLCDLVNSNTTPDGKEIFMFETVERDRIIVLVYQPDGSCEAYEG